MQDLQKVSSTQLFSFWRNLSVGLLIMIVTLFLSKLLPFYFSPIVGLIAAAILYTLLYNNKLRRNNSCMVVPYAMFYCIIIYSFLTIILNILDIWNIVTIPKELSFFNEPFIAALLFDPVCFFVFLVFYIRRNSLAICRDCKISKGLSIERGKLGEILDVETRLQLINLILVFGFLSAVVWVYYCVWYYEHSLVNNRDWYIFLWLNLIVFILDELYFASRYYNIYLDLKENGEIISEDELSDMTAKTYLRFYVICGNQMFVNAHVADPLVKNHYVLDTPFLTKRNVNGITTVEVHSIIKRLTGVNDGELRFFFGRKSPDIAKHRILRYFYFINPDNGTCPTIDLDGEWLSFRQIITLYNKRPKEMAKTMLIDLTRMITVILTQKIFDERGYRKIKTRSYQPSFDLEEIREKNYDFQDDKWIRVSMYNSDMKGFYFRKWIDRILKSSKEKKAKKQQWNQQQ